MDPVDTLTRCGGSARWARLRGLGVRDSTLRTAVRAGSVQQVARGGFALPGAPPGLVAAVRLGGVASHASAAELHGWPGWNPATTLQVSIPRGSVRAAAGVRVHRAALRPAEVEPLRACTTPLRTVADCARSMDLLDAVCVIDAALRAGAVSPCELSEVAARSRGPGTPALRRAFAHVDTLAGSALESVLRLALDLGRGRVRTQVWIRGAGLVDFLIDDWLVVEADGFAFHSDRAAYRTDRRRGNALTARGYGLLRFTWEDMRSHPLWVAGEVERVRRLGPGRRAAEHRTNG